MTPRISALVLSKDVEEKLPACLQTLEWVDELVVVDDESRDATRTIAESAGARVLVRRLESFARQRNAGLALCTGEWVLVVDADERVTPELRDEIAAVLAAPGARVGFRVPRRNHLAGRWVRGCGWYPDYVVRLFRREGVRYVATVHERPLLAGPLGTLRRPLLHFTYDSLAEYAAKMDRYSTMAAAERRAAGRRARLVDLLLRPPLVFVKCYLLRLGVLDGEDGLVIAAMSAHYTFQKYAKLRALARRAAEPATPAS
jgi:glycosyltransferase involved in cell wall biosynthesis